MAPFVTKRRIYKDYFKGAGEYNIRINDKVIPIVVDEHGIFETTDNDLPYYAIAAIVNSRRDKPY